MVSLIKVVEAGWPFNRAREQQWEAIQRALKTGLEKEGALSAAFALCTDTDALSFSVSVSLFCAIPVQVPGLVPALVAVYRRAFDFASCARSRVASLAHGAFASWVDLSLASGGGALHLYTKREEIPIPVPTLVPKGGGGDVKTLSMQGSVDSEMLIWTGIWEVFKGSASAPWRDMEILPEDRLPPIQGTDLARCAKYYSERTGRGCENVHPRWFGWLSPRLLDCFAALMMIMEASGFWPQQVMTILIALIPKSDGGRRPIGLLPAFVRLWEAVRNPHVVRWRSENTRSYNWAAKGRSAQSAVWKAALESEAAAARGEDSGSTLIDLVKAYERVKLEHVWRAGVRMNFPKVILKLMLESFAFERILKIGDAYSEGVFSLSAILAGGKYATDALFLVLVGPMDDLAILYPSVSLCTFVDDITLHVWGDSYTVAAILPSSTSWLIDRLEVDLDMRVSRAKPWGRDGSKKTVATFSSKNLHQRLEPTMRALGVATPAQVKLLGCDFAAGKVTKRTVQSQRMGKVTKRLRRYQQLGKKVGRHVLKTGGGPALKYGASIWGTPSRLMRKIRVFACAVQGSMGRRSPFARLKLAAYDPTLGLSTDPLVDWARGCWDNLVKNEHLAQAWREAAVQVGLATQPFQKVRGPAGGVLASAKRIGWSAPHHRHFLTKQGELLDLDLVCPLVVQQYAKRDFERCQAEESNMAKKLGFTPNLDPMAEILPNRSWKMTPAHASLRALGEDGWWTQARLRDEQFPGITDDFCRACMGPPHNRTTTGSLIHRCAFCQSTREVRDGFKDQDILEEARSVVHGNKPIFIYGIPAL